ncbi:MAG: amidohydrolase family protein, partial [Burkholderiales bacterium]|nr:amidohydrolase family protein [Burkholderiales bacterium]
MELPCLPPIENTKAPEIPSPPGTCDTHFHLFGPRAKFPFADSRSYTPDDAPLEKVLKMLDAIGAGRGVIVQGNAHGTDNSVVLDALRREPKRLRATCIVKPDTGKAELQRMADLGVRALRFHHMPHGV